MIRHYHLKEINIAMMKANTKGMTDITKVTMRVNGKAMNRLDSVNRVGRAMVNPAIRGKEEEDGATIVCDA